MPRFTCRFKKSVWAIKQRQKLTEQYASVSVHAGPPLQFHCT